MSDTQDPQGTDRKDGTPAEHDGATSHGSESENPGMPSPEPKAHRPRTLQDWWPEQLDLKVLHAHSPYGNPLGGEFDYAEQFAQLDVEELKADIRQVLNTS